MTFPGRRAVVVGLVMLAAAGAREGAAASGELRVGLQRLPPALDPAAAGSQDAMVFRHLYQGLVEFGERGEIEPALATQWTVSRDGLTWTFRLRPDVRFPNGIPLTPDVVVASLARHLAPDEPPRDAPGWSRIFRGPSALVREVRAGEPGTVQIQLSQPFSPLLALLAHPGVAIVMVAQNDSEMPFLGTGPYRVADRRPGRLVLEADPSQHAGPGRLVFLEIGDDAAGLAQLGPRGGLDVYFPLAPPAWAAIGLQVLSAPTWQMGLLALRSDQGVLNKKTARQAVAHALDPALVRAALGRWAAPLAGYLPPGAWGARQVPSLPHDPARARRLFGSSRGADPALTLLAPDVRSGPDTLRLAEAIRLSLAVAGAKLEVRPEPAEVYLQALRQGEGNLAVLETAVEVNDPHFAFQPLVASEAAAPENATNVAFYRSAAVDNLLLRASQLAFRPERLRLYQRLQAHLAEELPYIPLYVRLQWAVARPAVRGLRLDPGGRHRLDRVWVDASVDAGAVAPPAGPRP